MFGGDEILTGYFDVAYEFPFSKRLNLVNYDWIKEVFCEQI